MKVITQSSIFERDVGFSIHVCLHAPNAVFPPLLPRCSVCYGDEYCTLI